MAIYESAITSCTFYQEIVVCYTQGIVVVGSYGNDLITIHLPQPFQTNHATDSSTIPCSRYDFGHWCDSWCASHGVQPAFCRHSFLSRIRVSVYLRYGDGLLINAFFAISLQVDKDDSLRKMLDIGITLHLVGFTILSCHLESHIMDIICSIVDHSQAGLCLTIQQRIDRGKVFSPGSMIYKLATAEQHLTHHVAISSTLVSPPRITEFSFYPESTLPVLFRIRVLDRESIRTVCYIKSITYVKAFLRNLMWLLEGYLAELIKR